MTDALLPGAAAAWQVALSETSARILDIDVDVIRRERRPLECDARFLPLLAWERSVHHWTGIDETVDRTRTEASGPASAPTYRPSVSVDRARTEASFEDHLRYGCPEALEEEISLDVGYDVTVRDFFEAGLEWPDFEVVVPVVADVFPPAAEAVWKSALRRKNVRDWPVIVYEARVPAATVYYGAGSCLVLDVQTLPADGILNVGVCVFAAASVLFLDINTRPIR